jgi:hypothetical protein
MLFRYTRLFPASPLVKLLSAYLSLYHPNDKERDNDNGEHGKDIQDDFASIIIVCF